MTGVSYMIPFVTAGGILIALGFMISGDPTGFTGLGVQNALDGTDASGASLDPRVRIGAFFFGLAMAPWGFLLPALAGYIAYAIADRPGLVPGFAAGAVAGSIGSGFLGAMVGGLVAGYIANWISTWNVPAAVRSIMPIVVNPLISVIVTLAVMYFGVKNIVTPLNKGANNWLQSLGGGSAILLGVVIGLMMAFDMGGPVNKVAYTFGVAGLTAAGTSTTGAGLTHMAAVMAAGMTPPLGLALATVVRKNLFTDAERENGKAAWVLGASFITEGAIPFAAADPARVIPSIMVGSAVTGGLVEAFGNTLRAPHGGIAVFPLVGGVGTYVLAIVIGTVITAAAVVVAKGIGAKAAA
jgi:PTS system fructose-specific IIC component